MPISRVDVPYSRAITAGLVGDDVKGYKRATARIKPSVYPWPTKGAFTPLHGVAHIKAVKSIQKDHGLPQTGNIGPRTHELYETLARKGYPREHAFDARAIEILVDYWDATHITPEQRIRKNMSMVMDFYYGHRLSIRYSQRRPFPIFRIPTIPWALDCSGWATAVHYAAGARNPNRRAWDGLGYTGTLMNGGVRCDMRDMEIGDLIFYGWTTRNTPAFPTGSPTHVAPYAGQGMVKSLGSYPMGNYKYNYRGINHFRHYEVL